MSIYRLADRTREEADVYHLSALSRRRNARAYGAPQVEVLQTAFGPMLMSFHPSDVNDVQDLDGPSLALMYGEGFQFDFTRPNGVIDPSTVWTHGGTLLHVRDKKIAELYGVKGQAGASVSVRIGGDSWSKFKPRLHGRKHDGLGRVREQYFHVEEWTPAADEIKWDEGAIALDAERRLVLENAGARTDIVLPYLHNWKGMIKGEHGVFVIANDLSVFAASPFKVSMGG